MALPNLKRLRGDMTLEQLAGETGISVSQLSRYERGGPDGRDPKLAHLRALASCLRTTVDEIILDPGLRIYTPVDRRPAAGATWLVRGTVESVPHGSFLVDPAALRLAIEGAFDEMARDAKPATALSVATLTIDALEGRAAWLGASSAEREESQEVADERKPAGRRSRKNPA